MRNRYPGVCYRCNEPVGAGEGHFERISLRRPGEASRWRLQHATCAIEHRGTDLGKEHLDGLRAEVWRQRAQGTGRRAQRARAALRAMESPPLPTTQDPDHG